MNSVLTLACFQAALFGSVCTQLMATQLMTPMVRIFVEFVHAGKRQLLYLDNGETVRITT